MTRVTSESVSKSRPRRLAIAGVLCIIVGWGGVLSGYRELSFYGADSIEDPPLVAGVDTSRQESVQVFAHRERLAREGARRTQLPLATANLLLSGLLVVAATRAFGQRPGSRALVMQAVAANAGLAVASYAISRGLRAELVPAMVDMLRVGIKVPEGVTEAEIHSTLVAFVWTVLRTQLATLLLVYAVSLWGFERAES